MHSMEHGMGSSLNDGKKKMQGNHRVGRYFYKLCELLPCREVATTATLFWGSASCDFLQEGLRLALLLLQRPHASVFTLGFKKLRMRPALDDAPAAKYQDLVGAHHRREPVSDH